MTSLRSLLTGRSILVPALIALALSVTGCGGDDVIKIVGSTTPGDFPGNPVSNSFKAPDDAAMSHNGTDVGGQDVKRWSDSQSRKAILTWTADGRVWATFMKNGTFTPPVPIRGADTQGTQAQDVRVIWLNTSDHSNATARERDGDALILFRQEQIGDPGDADANDTLRLFSAYFDSSLRNTDSKTRTDSVSGRDFTFEHGFQKLAIGVDGDPDDQDTTNQRADVEQAGLISDSQNRSYGPAGGSSGDPTSFVHALWTQDPDAGASAAARQFLVRPFDLTQKDGFTFPGSPVQLSRPNGFDDGEEVENEWWAHNGSVFLNWGNNGSDDDDDTIIAYHQFAANRSTPAPGGVVEGPTRVNHIDDGDSTAGPPSQVTATLNQGNIYGADHGLDFTLIFFTEVGFDGDESNNAGSKNEDLDILVNTYDPADGSASGGAPSTNEIDEFTSESSNPISADVSRVATRISATGEVVNLAYQQSSSNDSTVDRNRVVKVRAFDPSRDLSAPTTPLSGTQVLTANTGGTDGGDVQELLFQSELADGTGNRLANVQSDPDVMNVTFRQSDLASTPVMDELHLAGFRVDTGMAAPAITQPTGFEDTVVAAVDRGWGPPGTDTRPRGVAYDNGTDGNPGKANVVFSAQANNPENAGAAGAFEERRLFHFEAGDTAPVNLTDPANVISTDASFDSQEVIDPNELKILTSPRNENDADDPGRFAHILFKQEDGTGNVELMHIPWQKKTAPPRLGPLTKISLDIGDDAGPLAAGTAGRKVGVFFTYPNEGHLYYNEWSPASGWQTDPDLVDNHYFTTEITDVQVFLDRDGTSSSLDDLPQAISAFGKRIDLGSERLLLRVRQ